MGKKLRIIQYSFHWLPTTQIWLYRQICHLDASIENFIICEDVVNINFFAVNNIYCLSKNNYLYYTFQKFLQKFISRRWFKMLESQILELKGDVLHSHFADFAWFNMLAVRKANLKHVVSFYGYDVNKLPHTKPIWRQRYQELFQEADLFLCEGPFMREAIIKLGCPEEKVRVHHLGVEPGGVKFQRYAYDQSQVLRVLIGSSFREKKGIPLALEALSSIHKEFPLEITIIGDADRDPENQHEKNRIMKTIEKFNMSSYVKLMGYQSHEVLMKEAYRHHLFLAPSLFAANGDSEGGAPVVLLDMMSTGIVVIGSTHCDIPHVIQDSSSGLLFEEGSVQSLIERLRWLMGQSQDVWDGFSRQARARIEQDYNVSLLAKELSDIYHEMSLNMKVKGES